jgi:MYXO-CTERM domain-containing protein
VDNNCDGYVDEGCACAEPCEWNECANGTCIDGCCVDLCEGVTCGDGEVCSNGECVERGCAGAYCDYGSVCRDGACVLEPVQPAESDDRRGRLAVGCECDLSSDAPSSPAPMAALLLLLGALRPRRR